MVFDSWGGALPHWAYPLFSLDYMQKIVAAMPPDVPVILFSKGGGQWLPLMAQSGAAGLGVDWTTPLAAARLLTHDRVALQGNMDPAVMTSNPATVRAEVARVLADYGHGHQHIFNLGHGITPDATPENVQAMVEAVHEFSPPYHGER